MLPIINPDQIYCTNYRVNPKKSDFRLIMFDTYFVL